MILHRTPRRVPLMVRALLMIWALALVGPPSVLPSQARLEVDRRLLGSAPSELEASGARMRLRTDLYVTSSDQGFVFRCSVQLLIYDAKGVPSPISVDRVWILSGDSIAMGSLGPAPDLARIDQGPWRRDLRLLGEWPSWLRNPDRADVVVRVVRDSQVLGYLRAAAQQIRKPPAPAPVPTALNEVTYLGALVARGVFPLQGIYRDGSLERHQVDGEAFPAGQPVHALTRYGRQILVRFDTQPPHVFWFDSLSARWRPRLYESCLDSLASPSDPKFLQGENLQRRMICGGELLERAAREGYADVALIWTGNVPVHFLASAPVQLDSIALGSLRAEGLRLWSRAIEELEPDERPSSMRFGAQRIEQVEGASDVVVAWFQVVLEHAGGQDDPRGGLFALYSQRERTVLFSSFGHPEWSPGSRIIYVKPYLYFRIGDDPRVYCLTQYQGAWESFGMAIFDIEKGREVVKSF
jgi:hypothetical protein